jgi:NAD(P)H-hydrate repair Nnr-like enzyme with NAD(P)H-hydrate dehydratase domain
MDVVAAAAAGVRLHVYAGLVAAERVGAGHTVAGDVIEALPEAFRRER